MTSSDVLVIGTFKVVTDTTEAACVYYGGAHLFEECLTNLVFVNYVETTNTKPLQQHIQPWMA